MDWLEIMWYKTIFKIDKNRVWGWICNYLAEIRSLAKNLTKWDLASSFIRHED